MIVRRSHPSYAFRVYQFAAVWVAMLAGMAVLSCGMIPLHVAHAQNMTRFITPNWGAGLASGTASLGSQSATGPSAKWLDLSQGVLQTHNVSVSQTGTVELCTASMEGSLDSQNWAAIYSGRDCSQPGFLGAVVTNFPVKYLRLNVTALAGGGSVAFSYAGVR
jgi:hypothetical protein